MRPSFLHYEIVEKLGQGGMGVVYLAKDMRLKRKVALKFLPEHITENREIRERFHIEAQAAAALSHTNIAQIYAIEDSSDGLFIVMEYVEGWELKECIKKGDLTLKEKEGIALQIACGTQSAHKKGIIHRDIKSSNIMVDEGGGIKIMDFGLARILGSTQITKAGVTMGTTAYMAPEQLLGKEADERSDIWSFGVVLYELFTGQLPFEGMYEQAVSFAILEEDPKPVTEITDDMPDHLDAIVKRCLEKKPDQRYATFDEVIADFSNSDLQYKRKTYLKNDKRVLRSKVTYLYKSLPVLALFLLLLYPISKFSGWEWFGAPGVPVEKGLAILPFKSISQSANASLDIISDGLLETLTSRLTQIDNYKSTLWVIPASEVIQKNITTPSEARKEFSVNLAIDGSLQEVGRDYLKFTMNLVDTRSLRQLSSRELEIHRDSLAALQTMSSKVLLEMLNIELEPEIDRAITLDQPGQSVASQYYLRGNGYLLRYEKDNNLNNAINSFQQAIDEEPSFALAHATLGKSYWLKYQLTDDTEYADKAKAALNDALRINDELVPVIATLGLINRGTGEYDEAITNFRKVITMEPYNDMAFRELAGIYIDLGELDKAEENYKVAIRLKPDYWMGYDDLGLFYYQYRGQLEKAIDQFNEVVRLTPDNYIGYSHLGAMYYFKGEYQRAKELLEKSLEIKETFFAASNLGTIYYSMKNFHEAIFFYSIAHKLNTNSYPVLGNLASAHEAIGNNDLAREYYPKAIALAEKQLEVNPSDEEVINDLGIYYADLGDNKQALKYLNRSLELDSNSMEILFRTATAYERMGDRENALMWIEKALEKGYPISDIRNQPELQELIADQRFIKLSEKIARE